MSALVSVLAPVVATLAATAGVALPLWAAHRLPQLVARARTRTAERSVARDHRLYLMLVRTGRRAGRRGARTDRALHNDFDADCVHWWGDRDPETNDHRNLDFGDAPTRTDERRCVVCRPRTEEPLDLSIALPPAQPVPPTSRREQLR